MSTTDLNDVIYLDHNATTPLDPDVLKAMLPYLEHSYGNASSVDHLHGSVASMAVNNARRTIADAVGARTDEIVFTSGATESDNLALTGVMERYKDRGDHLITCSTEHEAVLSTARYLERAGKKVTYLPVDELGHIDLDDLRKAITDKTVLISIMAANNEIGTIHDITGIGRIAHDHGVLFHTDAAQAVGHIPINVRGMGIDLMSFSAHKLYGPKGVGALYIRGSGPMVRLEGMMHGGGQERGMRPGTLNVPAIVGFATAVELADKHMHDDNARIGNLAAQMLDILKTEGAILNGDPERRLAGNLNVYYPGIDAKAVINSVSDRMAISAGSACTTQSVEPSHVIMALGHGEDRAYSSIRIGLGRYSREDQTDFAAREIAQAVVKLRNLSDSGDNGSQSAQMYGMTGTKE